MMKKIFSFIIVVMLSFCFVSCAKTKSENAIELMGAGDRIHDTYTFANSGVNISKNENDIYTIFGDVEPLSDAGVKKEFNIDDDVTHIVAIKLTNTKKNTNKDEVEISVNGVRNYDAEHLNGTNYTFILLEALKGKVVTISVKWNGNSQEETYVVNFSENINLK